MAGLKAKQALGLLPGKKLPKHDFSRAAAYTPQEVEAITNAVLAMFNDEKGVINRVDSLRGHDIAITATESLIEDAFTAVADPDFYSVEYINAEEKTGDALSTEIGDSIKKIEKDLGLKKFILDLLPDIIYYGQYPIRLVLEANKKKGDPESPDAGKSLRKVIGIQDSFDLKNTWVMCKGSEVVHVYQKKEDKLVSIDSAEVAMFEVSTYKKRLKAESSFGGGQIDAVNLPEYFRVGQALIEPVIPMLYRVRILEMALMCDDLRHIFSPLIVMVGVPTNAQPTDVVEIVKKYETDLREMLPTNASLEEITFAELVSLVSRVKVLPSYQDMKGKLDNFRVDTDITKFVTEIERIRKHIAMTLGFPWYYFSMERGSEAPENKQIIVKTQTRYAKKLQAAQLKTGSSIRNLYHTILQSWGYPVEIENLKVKFKTVVDVDALNNMDYYLAASECMAKVTDALKNLQDSGIVPVKFDKTKLVAWINVIFGRSSKFDGVVLEGEDESMAPPPARDRGTGPSRSPSGEPGGSEEPIAGEPGGSEAPPPDGVDFVSKGAPPIEQR